MSGGIRNNVNSLEAIRNLPPDVNSVKGNSLGDPEVIAIASLRSLRELDLSGCDGITDHSVSQLRQVASLEELDLSFCNQITDASLTALGNRGRSRRLLELYSPWRNRSCGYSRLRERGKRGERPRLSIMMRDENGVGTCERIGIRPLIHIVYD